MNQRRILGVTMGFAILAAVFLLPFTVGQYTLFQISEPLLEVIGDLRSLPFEEMVSNYLFVAAFFLLVIAGLVGYFPLGTGILGIVGMAIVSIYPYLESIEPGWGIGFYVGWGASIGALGAAFWRRGPVSLPLASKSNNPTLAPSPMASQPLDQPATQLGSQPGFCSRCGSKSEGNAIFCYKCGAPLMGHAQATPSSKPVQAVQTATTSSLPLPMPMTAAKTKKVGLAALLSLVLPGLGQLYVGDRRKGVGLIVVTIVLGLILIALDLGFTLIIYWIYSVVDAYQTAKRYNTYLLRNGRPPW